MTDREGLQVALGVSRSRYRELNPVSAAHDEIARRSLPGGNTRTTLYYAPFPLVFERAEGSRLFSMDGDEYVDFLGEYTAGLYGHSHPEIIETIKETLDRGIVVGGYGEHEAALASEITSRFPSMELLRFTNSGTEANLMALAAATAFTGRPGVVVFSGGYHGGVLSFALGVRSSNVPYDFRVGRYNDIDGARDLLRAGDVAAVVVEPMLGSGGTIPADPGFLRALREEADRSGALLIFDEVMTSRLGPGGVQGELGIRPDLTTLGKYLGGGMSFGAFGGREDLMAQFDPSRADSIPHAGTFNNNVLTMAAGLAGLRKVLDPATLRQLNERGDRLRLALNEVFERADVPMLATGVGSLLTIHATRGPVTSAEDLQRADPAVKELLFFHLINDGIWLARRGMMALSLAITDEEVAALRDSVCAFVDRHRELFVPPTST